MAWTSQVGNGYYGNAFTTGWKYDNAWEIWQYFVSRGATEEAAAGILGNMTYEGEMNPGQIQHGFDPNDPLSGRGLIGWTPGTKIIDYANHVGANWYDGDVQCEYIFYHPEGYPSGNYNFFPNSAQGYNYSWSEFLQITDVSTAALAWLYEAERPKHPEATKDARVSAARAWYDEFHGQVTPGPAPPDPPDPGPNPPDPPIPQPPGSPDIVMLGGRDVMRRIWFKK